MQLTPEGERLYAHVSAAMSQILAAEEELSDSTGCLLYTSDNCIIGITANEERWRKLLLNHGLMKEKQLDVVLDPYRCV